MMNEGLMELLNNKNDSRWIEKYGLNHIIIIKIALKHKKFRTYKKYSQCPVLGTDKMYNYSTGELTRYRIDSL